MFKLYSKKLRYTAAFMAANVLVQTFGSTIAFALTNGPETPEFSSFTPVATSDMVDVFSGGFNYNLPVIEIPGPHGGGYAMSLSYNSGVLPEQEASWVGFGWNLNPGSINRSMRGIPDEYNNKSVITYNKTRPYWSGSSGSSIGMEVSSVDDGEIPKKSSSGGSDDKKTSFNAGLNLQFTRHFNNYTGYHYSKGIGLGINVGGIDLGLDINIDENGPTFRPKISVANILSKALLKNKKNEDQENNDTQIPSNTDVIANGTKKKLEVKSLRFNTSRLKQGLNAMSILGGLVDNAFSIGNPYYPNPSLSTQPTVGFGYNFSASLQVNPKGPIGIQAGQTGSFSANFVEKPIVRMPVKGYLNTPTIANDVETSMLDYTMERGQSMGRFDKYAGIPFANYDIFSVAGEGVLGSFHAYPNQIGQFTPFSHTSKNRNSVLGFEIGVGGTLQIGFDIGGGKSETKLGAWKDDNFTKNKYIIDKDKAFRFEGDMGDMVEYESEQISEVFEGVPFVVQPRKSPNSLNSASVATLSPIPGFKFPYLSEKHAYKLTKPVQKSSFIEPTYKDDLLHEMSITKSDGSVYNYAFPNYVRNETSVSVNIDNSYAVENHSIATKPQGNGLKLVSDDQQQYRIASEAFSNSSIHKSVLGQTDPNKYAKNFLLSNILSPSYIDVNNNGPDQNDFGGWTKFDYRKVYGSNGEAGGKWYRYRNPYFGLQYQQNSISNTLDDLGSVSTGEKEVHYLHTVETATHIAYFVTNKTQSENPYLVGSQESRKDGIGAAALTPDGDPAARGKDQAVGAEELEYLEKIVLYKKNTDGGIVGQKPVKTVKFEYDYTLVPNLPNSALKGSHVRYGKLTLKKLWFEYNGTHPLKISPYKFTYQYDNELLDFIPEQYIGIKEDYEKLLIANQNPEYSTSAADSWGYRTPNRNVRAANGINFPDQRAIRNNIYDPAQYHLKKITLPSGGEIHVQYEGNDYAKVQDRAAMTMATISNLQEKGDDGKGNSIISVKVSELGLALTDFEGDNAEKDYANAVRELEKQMDDYFVKQGNKSFFKILYSLKGNTDPSLDNCKSDYIEGYAKISSINYKADTEEFEFVVTYENSNDGNRITTPRQACLEFVLNQRKGKLNSTDCVEPRMERNFDNDIQEAADEYAAEAALREFEGFNKLDDAGKDSRAVIRGQIKDFLKSLALNGDLNHMYNYEKSELCLTANLGISFLRLPVYKRKIVGGARVKRLLMLDANSIEEDGNNLFGTEYHYVLTDGSSSGVATNEPPVSRDENPLYQPLEQEGQSLANKLIAGENRDQQEGPLGSSILPVASIGYQRVVVSNIYKGKSSPGHTVHEYYTCADFPYDKLYSQQGNQFDYTGSGVSATDLSNNKVKDRLPLYLGVFNLSLTKLFGAQGFRFVQNSMHGKIRQISTYAGPYTSTNESEIMYSKLAPTSFTRYDYYAPGEKVKTLSLVEGGRLLEEWTVPGKDMEIAREGRRVKETSVSFNMELDINIELPIPPPIIYPTFFASLSVNDNATGTHTTSKIIRYPAMVKSVISYQDGITSQTDNIAFNKQTGKPILTATYDSYHQDINNGHSGAIYNMTMPAAWIYPALGPKTLSISNTNQLEAGAVSFTTYGVSPLPESVEKEEYENTTKVLNLQQVLQASIQTYKKDWQQELLASAASADYGLSGSMQSNYADNAKTLFSNKWLPHKSYTYQAKRLTGDNIQSKGYFSIPEVDASISTYYWKSPGDNWLMNSENKLFSPNSEPLQEMNALGIHSTAKFGKAYGFNLPVMMANNAKYDHIFFSSFEDEASVNQSGKAHSGNRALDLDGTYSFTINNSGELEDGGLAMLWVSGAQTASDIKLAVNGRQIVDSKVVATVGDWSLVKWIISGDQFNNTSTSEITLVPSETSAGSITIDDLRFQPLKAQGTCYVYDAVTFKLLAQFDDQHFGLYYQYDQEGKLVRKQVETVRGKMTIQETYYNTPKASR